MIAVDLGQAQPCRSPHNLAMMGTSQSSPHVRLAASLLAVGMLLASSGCTALLAPVSGVPASRLPPELLAEPRADRQPIDLSRLVRPAMGDYRLDHGDVLGVYIKGVLGPIDAPPPVNPTPAGSDLPPSVGTPIPVQEDGSIHLPLIEPLEVRGLTIEEARRRILAAYTTGSPPLLLPDAAEILVSLVRRRTIEVIVVRRDSFQGHGGAGVGTAVRVESQEGVSQIVPLEVGSNDVLRALVATGGLPGVNAQPVVKIVRKDPHASDWYDELVQGVHGSTQNKPCRCPPILPDSPNVTVIPLRLPPGQVPNFPPEAVILHDGDIVLIENRETEVFYTQGLLPPGEHVLPRDYDLDVLQAISLAGGNSLSGSGNAGGGMGAIGGMVDIAPTQLFVIRRAPCGQQFTISVDLARALDDPRERILVQPGDILVLRYKPAEDATRFSLFTFFTYGIQQLLQGNRR